jgi:ComF family protein
MYMQLKQALKDALHLFFPHICNGCGTDVIDAENLLCLRCLTALPVTNFFDQPGNPVEQKFYGRMPVCNAAAAYFFTKDSLLQHLVHQLKYRGNKDNGIYLGELVGQQLAASARFANVDAIVPLPLNKRRQKKRGYNQALMIANGMASYIRKPVLESAVIRMVYTETQTQRSRITRWENMEGVFKVVDPEALKNRHILLVDDIITTGATLEACGAEILKVEGSTLSIGALAYTI